jgi:hypothetical protein
LVGAENGFVSQLEDRGHRAHNDILLAKRGRRLPVDSDQFGLDLGIVMR